MFTNNRTSTTKLVSTLFGSDVLKLAFLFEFEFLQPKIIRLIIKKIICFIVYQLHLAVNKLSEATFIAFSFTEIISKGFIKYKDWINSFTSALFIST